MIAEKRLLIPVLLALVIGSLFLGVVAGRSSADLDRLALEHQVRLLDTALRNLSTQLGRSVKDWSWWDEALANLVTRFNPQWVETSLVSQSAVTFRLDSVWVLGADDRLIYGRELDPAATGTDPAPVPAGMLPLIRQARVAPMDEPQPVTGLIVIRGQPHLAAASALTPEAPDPTQLEYHDRPVLVFTRALKPELLDEIARGYLLAGLRLTAASPPGGGHTLYPLTGADGAPLGELTWTRARPGERFLHSLAPAGAATALTVLFAFWVFYRRVREGVRYLEGVNARLEGANRELEAAMRRAEAANRAKSTFLANVNHELRTPLNCILGYAQVLRGSAGLDPHQTGLLDTIRQSGDHLLGMVGEVLDMAKIEAGRLDLSYGPVQLDGLFLDLQALFQGAAADRGIALRWSIEGPLPGRVEGDGQRLRQILVNLIGNALKFTPHGEVRIEACFHEGILEVAVIDTGIGIAPERLPQIFEPFQQEGAPEYRNQGVGLGLAISRGLAERMGGEVCAESTLGEGSRFTLALPLRVLGEIPTVISPTPLGPVDAGEGVDVPPALRETLYGMAQKGDILGIGRALDDMDGQDPGVQRLRQAAADLDVRRLRELLRRGGSAFEG